MGTVPDRIGVYRILGVLGSGGMGVVYEAEHESIQRRAAIKVLHDLYAFDTEVTQRFFDEARAAARIEHPSVVQIYEVGMQPSGSPYLVMELLQGQSLAQRLKSPDKPRDLPTLLRFMLQVAEALACAHQRGVIHRDIKPENVFIVADPVAPGGERAKVVDFGLAKLLSAGDRTKTGHAMGTPQFMPPEQWLDAKRADGKSDSYAFGVMLFEVLSGRLPFRAGNAMDLAEQHLALDASHLGAQLPGLPPVLAELVAALLRKVQVLRPDMETVAQCLSDALANSIAALALLSRQQATREALAVKAPGAADGAAVDVLAPTPPVAQAPLPAAAAVDALAATAGPNKHPAAAAVDAPVVVPPRGNPAPEHAPRAHGPVARPAPAPAIRPAPPGPVLYATKGSPQSIELRARPRDAADMIAWFTGQTALLVYGVFFTFGLVSLVAHKPKSDNTQNLVPGPSQPRTIEQPRVQELPPTSANKKYGTVIYSLNLKQLWQQKLVQGDEIQIPEQLVVAIPCSAVDGRYEICFSGAGVVASVEPVISIPWADASVVNAVKTWKFPTTSEFSTGKCLRETIVFQVDNQEGLCPSYRADVSEAVEIMPDGLIENMKGGIYLTPSRPKMLPPLKPCEKQTVGYFIDINEDGIIPQIKPLDGFNSKAADREFMAQLKKWRFRELSFYVRVWLSFDFRGAPTSGTACAQPADPPQPESGSAPPHDTPP